jgi:hypothetical protein
MGTSCTALCELGEVLWDVLIRKAGVALRDAELWAIPGILNGVYGRHLAIARFGAGNLEGFCTFSFRDVYVCARLFDVSTSFNA